MASKTHQGYQPIACTDWQVMLQSLTGSEKTANIQNDLLFHKKSDVDEFLCKVTGKLYTIRNIANLAFQCPDKYAEVYILQDIVNHISNMAQELIEEINV